MQAQGVRIVVDAMGGDHAPSINVKGALLALQATTDLSITLVGDKALLLEELKKQGGAESDRLALAHSAEVISMEDHGASSIRKKKQSSIHIGLEMVRDGGANAFVSAGNSGAIMAGALLILGRIADVERPAIVVKLPTVEGFVIVLDAGANVDCRPSHLAQFAQLGHIYATVIEGLIRPKIALLSNGSETHKGNELTRESHELIRQTKDLNYVGYVEGYDIFRGTADVIVCDGFVGNVILKEAEGLSEMVFAWFRRQIQKDWLGLMGMVLLRRVLQNFKKKFDYQPYGAAPLLGINGMVLISHGGSTEVAIQNGILTAKRGVDQGFVQRMSEHFGRGQKRSEELKKG